MAVLKMATSVAGGSRGRLLVVAVVGVALGADRLVDGLAQHIQRVLRRRPAALTQQQPHISFNATQQVAWHVTADVQAAGANERALCLPA